MAVAKSSTGTKAGQSKSSSGTHRPERQVNDGDGGDTLWDPTGTLDTSQGTATGGTKGSDA